MNDAINYKEQISASCQNIRILNKKNYRYRAMLHFWIFIYTSLKAIYEFTLIQFESIFETSYLRYAYTKSSYVKQI